METLKILLELKYINYPKFFVIGTGKVLDCFVSMNEYVLKGQPLFSFEDSTLNKYLTFNSPISGMITDFVVKKNDIVKRDIYIGQILASSYLNDFDDVIFQKTISKISQIEITKTIDDFDNTENVYISKIGGQNEHYFKMISVDDTLATYFIGLTFQSLNGRHFIKFCSSNPEFMLLQSETIILLFDDNIKLTFSFLDSSTSSKNLYINIVEINQQVIETFLTKNILKWRLTNFKKDNIYGDFSNKFVWLPYKSSLEARYLLKQITKEYISSFKQFD